MRLIRTQRQVDLLSFGAAMTEQRFRILVPEQAIDDLHQRLERTRWPDTVTGSAWTYGLDLDWMKSIVEYWRETYDWRAQERALNTYPHYIAEIATARHHARLAGIVSRAAESRANAGGECV